jgi:polyadenylation factor subunit 2
MHFWVTEDSNPITSIEAAHVTSVFALGWHPMGHILASGSNDHTTRFWTRNRPGDPMNDAINLSKEEAEEMGLEQVGVMEMEQEAPVSGEALPGLGMNRPRPSTGYNRSEDRQRNQSGDDRNQRQGNRGIEHRDSRNEPRRNRNQRDINHQNQDNRDRDHRGHNNRDSNRDNRRRW